MSRQHAYINGERRRDLEKLTPAMWRMLHDLLKGTNSLHGRSEHGGATWTRVALRKRGLMQGGELTAAGKEACAVEWRPAHAKPHEHTGRTARPVRLTMTRRHLELAAKLWALALVAHTEPNGEDTRDKVRKLASARAQTKLRNLGTEKAEIIDEDDAIAVAARLLSK